MMSRWHINWETGQPCDCGFGRNLKKLAKTASWQPGTWGQGLWWPQTDRVLIWSDDKTQREVESADENASSGPAVRFQVQPSGTVRANDESSPIEGLQRAVEAFDPSLRVDHSPWDMGGLQSPTEPVPTFPESEDEGRKHNVQITDTYQGYGS